MSLNSTPRAQRLHIGIFGRRNVGKSSLINALTGQNIAIVSDVKGTTTDPVFKAMEIAPLGPVVFIDTPGIDDVGSLGEMRIEKTYEVLSKTDVALLVMEYGEQESESEKQLVMELENRKITYFRIINKTEGEIEQNLDDKNLYINCITGKNIEKLKNILGELSKEENKLPLVSDLVKTGDTVILVTPIDESAPAGRLILPQQQVIRDLLDNHVKVVIIQPEELSDALKTLKDKPSLVITDSQAFKKVAENTPEDILLTSFSILFARYKGILEDTLAGIEKVEDLNDGDYVLISEGCTHHKQCGDIGSVKIPHWLEQFSGKKLKLEFTSGGDFPRDLRKYSLIIHCGGCTLNEKEVTNRMLRAKEQSIPMTNYGLFISLVQGTLKRSLKIFSNLAEKLA